MFCGGMAPLSTDTLLAVGSFTYLSLKAMVLIEGTLWFGSQISCGFKRSYQLAIVFLDLQRCSTHQRWGTTCSIGFQNGTGKSVIGSPRTQSAVVHFNNSWVLWAIFFPANYYFSRSVPKGAPPNSWVVWLDLSLWTLDR